MVGGVFIATMDINQYTMSQENIKTKIVFATAIITTGFSIGDSVWPIIFKVFLDPYGWRGALLLVAAIVSNIAVLLMVETTWGIKFQEQSRTNCKQHESNPGELEQTDVDIGLKENPLDGNIAETSIGPSRSRHKCDITIWDALMIAGHFFFFCGHVFSQDFIAVRMDHIGLLQADIVTVLSAKGMIGLIRVLPSFLIDKFKLNRIKVTGFISLTAGILCMSSTACTTFPLMMVFGVSYGFLQCKCLATIIH